MAPGLTVSFSGSYKEAGEEVAATCLEQWKRVCRTTQG